MKKNIGMTDRIIRFVLFDLLLGISLMGVDLPQMVANICFMVSLLFGLTILFAYSPIYHLIGLTTKERISNN